MDTTPSELSDEMSIRILNVYRRMFQATQVGTSQYWLKLMLKVKEATIPRHRYLQNATRWNRTHVTGMIEYWQNSYETKLCWPPSLQYKKTFGIETYSPSLSDYFVTVAIVLIAPCISIQGTLSPMATMTFIFQTWQLQEMFYAHLWRFILTGKMCHSYCINIQTKPYIKLYLKLPRRSKCSAGYYNKG